MHHVVSTFEAFGCVAGYDGCELRIERAVVETPADDGKAVLKEIYSVDVSIFIGDDCPGQEIIYPCSTETIRIPEIIPVACQITNHPGIRAGDTVYKFELDAEGIEQLQAWLDEQKRTPVDLLKAKAEYEETERMMQKHFEQNNKKLDARARRHGGLLSVGLSHKGGQRKLWVNANRFYDFMEACDGIDSGFEESWKEYLAMFKLKKGDNYFHHKDGSTFVCLRTLEHILGFEGSETGYHLKKYFQNFEADLSEELPFGIAVIDLDA